MTQHIGGSLGAGLGPRLQLYRSIELDRQKQWIALCELCDRPDSFLLLLHGDEEQSLEIFYERLGDALRRNDTPQQRQLRDHKLVILEQQGGDLPRTAAGWTERLSLALRSAGYQGTPREQLAAARGGDEPVFLVIGRDALRVSWFRPTSPAAFDVRCEALRDFLCEELHQLLDPGMRAYQPVRVLLGLTYPPGTEGGPAAELRERVRDWVGLGKPKAGRGRYSQGNTERRLIAVELPPAVYPSWEDVEQKCHAHRPNPSDALLAELRKAYHRAFENNRPFAELCRSFDDILAETEDDL